MITALQTPRRAEARRPFRRATAVRALTGSSVQDPDVAFDVQALREKYAHERDRRLRPDGIAQYVEIAGAVRRFRRRPMERSAFHPGSVARRCRRRDRRRRVRRTADRRPAAASSVCRTSGSSTRPPTSAAPGTGTATRASPATSSRTCTCRCSRNSATSRPRSTPRATRSSRTAGASPSTTTCTATPACRPRSPKSVGTTSSPGGSSRPTTATRSGHASSSMANGYLQKPKLPGIDGIESFRGHAFHTSRWDYDYTGGDDLRLNAGGQAGRDHRHRRDRDPVRAAPRRGRRRHLFVFQRTPSTVDVRGNRPTDPEWVGGPQDRLAAPPHRELPAAHRGRRGRRGPGRRRLDEHRQEALRDAAAQRRGHVGRRPFARSRTGRLRQDGGDPRPRRLDRDGSAPPQRRSSRGTATSASGRASTTSTCRRSTATT